ncbi:MAG: hypothetical protein K8T20_01710 [Planctomycetes bacterium]|nr:hypothetical protein [Planctomycetota bacterium]
MKKAPSLATCIGGAVLTLLAVGDVLWVRAAARTTLPVPGPQTPLRTTQFRDLKVDSMGEGWCCSSHEWNRLRDEKGQILVDRCGLRAESSCGLVAVAETNEWTSPTGRLLFLNANAPVTVLHSLAPGTYSAPSTANWSRDGRRILVRFHDGLSADSIRVLTFDAGGRTSPKSEVLQIPVGKTWEVKGLPPGVSAAPGKLILLSHGNSWSASDKSFVVGQWLDAGLDANLERQHPLALYRCSANPPRLEELVGLFPSSTDAIEWTGETPGVAPRK